MYSASHQSIVLFDGYCNLCSRSVVFVLKRERDDVFRFASLQSDFASRLLANMKMEDDVPDSIALVEDKHVYTRSTAALHMAKRLRHLWPLLYIFILVPRFIRDPVYDWIARNRYKWFGRRSPCFVSKQDVRHKFLDQ
ncbi:MAG: DCC1-like thiol-disulfide oxidoreductase family protein [Bacteroidales bacterium]|nr:DCC1-like thiol-disulfide oxidoreductase family protein [Bacteroidales bacterium]